MSKKRVAELARLGGLHTATKAGMGGESLAAGTLQGFLVAASWTRRGNQAGVYCLVRFKPDSWTGGPEALRTAASESRELMEALNKKKVPGALLKGLELGPDGFLLFWPYSFFTPKPDRVLAILRALTALAARYAQPIGGTCEDCGTQSGVQTMLADWIPVSVCRGCQLRQDAEAQQEEEAYARLEPNPVLGITYGLGMAFALALAWGGVAFVINRIFVLGGILIGFSIAWAINKGMGKVNLVGRALTVLLTLASVFAGDYVFILLSSAKHLDRTLDLDLAFSVANRFLEIEFSEASGYLSLLFALIGAGYILYINRPPTFRKHYQPLG